MATIVSKRMGPAGSRGHLDVYYDSALTAADMTFTYENGEDLVFVPEQISKMTIGGGSNVTVNGQAWTGPGTYDFWESPLPATTAIATGVGAGPVVVCYQGLWENA